MLRAHQPHCDVSAKFAVPLERRYARSGRGDMANAVLIGMG